jgi:putative ABC transport system permease protein
MTLLTVRLVRKREASQLAYIKVGNKRMKMIITIAIRNIMRNFRRTMLCIIAVAIAVFFTIIMQAMMSGMVDSMGKVVRTFDTGDVSIVSTGFDEQSDYYPMQYPVADGSNFDELKKALMTIPGVKKIFPRIMAYAVLNDNVIKNALLWGIDIESETAFHHFNLSKNSNGIVEGRYPDPNTNECIIGLRMAEKGNLKIGDSIPLQTTSAEFSGKLWNPKITGIFSFDYLKYDEDAIIVPFDRLQRLLTLGEATQQIFIYGENPQLSPSIAAAAQALLGNNNVVREWRDNYFVVMMRQSMVIFIIVYLVFIIVASFLIVNTIVMIIHERIKEIGMMGSLGMTRREIVEVFFFEAVFLSVAGAIAGCILGSAACIIMSFFPLDFNAMQGGGMKEFPVSGTIRFVFDWKIIFQGFILGVLVSSLCTLFPSLKSAFVEPVEALRR